MKAHPSGWLALATLVALSGITACGSNEPAGTTPSCPNEAGPCYTECASQDGTPCGQDAAAEAAEEASDDAAAEDAGAD